MGVLNPNTLVFSYPGADIESVEKFVNSEKWRSPTITEAEFSEYVRRYRHGWFYEHGRGVVAGERDIDV